MAHREASDPNHPMTAAVHAPTPQAPLWRRLAALVYDLLAVVAIVMVTGLLCQMATRGQLTDSSGGFGTTVLSGTNFLSATNVVGTTLQVTNNASVGAGTVTLDNAQFQADGFSNLTFTNNFKINSSINGSAIDANGATLTIAGNITDGNGPGKLTVLDSSFGSGAVVLLGTNTYSGGTFICVCASLQLGDTTHKASLVGNITNEGQLRSSTPTHRRSPRSPTMVVLRRSSVPTPPAR